jgi:ketosteroid isomerase-like protein
MQPADLDANLRRAFERWNRGDYSFDDQEVDPDIEIVSAFGGIEERTYRGHDGLARWVQDVTEAFDEWRLHIDEIEHLAADRALVVGAVHFRGRGSGLTVDLPCAWLMEHDEGRLTRFEAYPNRVDEARDAAGR